jgi:hypothetical protein
MGSLRCILHVLVDNHKSMTGYLRTSLYSLTMVRRKALVSLFISSISSFIVERKVLREDIQPSVTPSPCMPTFPPAFSSPTPPPLKSKSLAQRVTALHRIEVIVLLYPHYPFPKSNYAWLTDPNIPLTPLWSSFIPLASLFLNLQHLIDTMVPYIMDKWQNEGIAVPEIDAKTGTLKVRQWTTPVIIKGKGTEDTTDTTKEHFYVCLLPFHGRDRKAITRCGHIIGSQYLQLWAAERRDDPTCPPCRQRVYDLQHYVPESCRESFNGVLGSLNTFRAFAEDVDDRLIIGMHDDYQDKVRLLVDKLGMCKQGLRGHLATLR